MAQVAVRRSHRRAVLWGIVLLGAAATLVAQAPPQRTPLRDSGQPSQRGTAVIRGRIVAADSGRPLRRAEIRISAPEAGREPRTTSTDADGRYEFAELPAGRYTMLVRRRGFLPLRYGQRRPLEQGKPLDVLDRQVVDDVDFAMPRMSTIAGRIVNDLGEPAAGVMVYALRSMYVGGRRRLVPSGETLVRTDESGDYRIMGLAPGTYLIVAQTNEEWTVDMGRLTETMGYAPTYFPGTTNVGDAGKIVLGLGAEAGGTDFSLIPGRAASVSGVALDSRGVPFKVVFVRQEVRGQNFGMFGSAGRVAVAADGGFTIAKIPPGEYKLEAARPADEESGSGPEVAIMPIVVNGSDVENVILSGSAGGTVSGRVTTDTGAAPRLPRLWITIIERQLGQPDPLLFGMFQTPGASQVGEDGTFSVPGVFGSPRFDVSLPEGWMVRAILHDGRDITDRPIELGSGERLSGVQVIVTDRVTTIGGTLTDDKDAPVADGTVIVFAADRSKWYDGSRFVKAARPDQKGRYRIKGVPPGDYLLAAVEYAEDGAWNDPDFLEPLQRDARKVALAEGDSQTISLKLTPR